MKKAIVIGASSGIGRELSKILSKNQYTVGIMARRVHLLDELCKGVGNKVLVERIDVVLPLSQMLPSNTSWKKARGISLEFRQLQHYVVAGRLQPITHPKLLNPIIWKGLDRR